MDVPPISRPCIARSRVYVPFVSVKLFLARADKAHVIVEGSKTCVSPQKPRKSSSPFMGVTESQHGPLSALRMLV